MAVWGVALGTAYILWLYYRVAMGDLRPKLRGLLHLDLNVREVATLTPLALLALAIGLYPECVLGFLRASVTQLLAAVPAAAEVAGRL